MKPIFIAISLAILALFTASTGFAQDHGLNNRTKKFTDPDNIEIPDMDDPAQIERTWQAAIVRIPTGPGKSVRSSVAEVSQALADTDARYPAAIYVHGCSGIWEGTHRRVKFLADNGFLVIAPASFARTKYPRSCDAARHAGGMYRPILGMRQLDAGYAIEQAKALPFVDPDNVLLIGLSEGGVTAATFEPANPLQTVAARVIEGWTCAAGWYEYAGLNAPDTEPVLSLVGEKDPWYQNEWNKGHCGTYMNEANGSKSVVYDTGRLSRRHELIEFPEAQAEVLAFLKAHMKLPLNTREVQQLLVDLGFDPGPVDGAWGGKTLRALNELRAQHGLDEVETLENSSQTLLQSLLGD